MTLFREEKNGQLHVVAVHNGKSIKMVCPLGVGKKHLLRVAWQAFKSAFKGL